MDNDNVPVMREMITMIIDDNSDSNDHGDNKDDGGGDDG